MQKEKKIIRYRSIYAPAQFPKELEHLSNREKIAAGLLVPVFEGEEERGNPSSDNNCQQFNAINQHEDDRSTRTHQGSDNHSNGNTSESSSNNLDDLSVRANASDSNASQNF